MDASGLPHVIGGNDREGIICPVGSEWYQSKHLRRGRLVEWVCGQTAMGRAIPANWWADHSGERDDDRVEHEECRPYLAAYLKVLAITGAKVVHAYPQIEVIHPTLDYVGHIDQIWLYSGVSGMYRNCEWIVDLKNGEPAPFHALQLAAYRDADGAQHNRPLRPALNLYLPSRKIVERNDIRDVQKARTLAKAYQIRKELGLR